MSSLSPSSVQEVDQEILELTRKRKRLEEIEIEETKRKKIPWIELGDTFYDKKEYYSATKMYSYAIEYGYTICKARLYDLGKVWKNKLKDNKEAFQWYLRGAKQNGHKSQFEVAYMYDTGTGVEVNFEQAFKWYKKSADNGIASSQYKLAMIYDNGRGVQSDIHKAIEYYKKAAENGILDAFSSLGYIYMDGHVDDSDANIIIRKNTKEAMVWFRNGAKKGGMYSQREMGRAYHYGHGNVKQNYQTAGFWYRKSAEQGDPVSSCSLGDLYKNGNGVVQSDKNAMKWYGKAAEKGNVTAMYNLGVVHERNPKGDIDDYSDDDDIIEIRKARLRNAFTWYTKAANKGCVKSQIALGKLYSTDDCCSDMSIQCYTMAAEKGNSEAQYLLANGYIERKNNEQVVKWMTMSADKKYSKAQYELGYLYEIGDYGLPIDLPKAIQLYQASANKKNVKAMYKLGHLYETGMYEDILPKNEELAMQW